MAIAFSARVYWRAFEYRDGFTLYQADLARSPNSFILHTNVGVELFRKGEIDEAQKHFEEAVSLMPKYGTALTNLGVIYQRKGDYKTAEWLHRRSIEISNYSLAYKNLAELLAKLGHRNEAIAVLRQGVSHYPTDVSMQSQLKALE